MQRRQDLNRRKVQYGRKDWRRKGSRGYKVAFKAAMEIFQLSKEFPAEESYSLTDQIRCSSRSICSNLAEAWRKRRYPAVFINKLSDAMQEGSETQAWLDFCLACEYMTKRPLKSSIQNMKKYYRCQTQWK